MSTVDAHKKKKGRVPRETARTIKVQTRLSKADHAAFLAVVARLNLTQGQAVAIAVTEWTLTHRIRPGD